MKRININLDSTSLTGPDLKLAQATLKPNGSLRASKPQNAPGDTQYIWRMVVFMVSDNPRHQCMPVMAEFDLDAEWFIREVGRQPIFCHCQSDKHMDTYDRRRLHLAHLNKIADAIVDVVPVLERSGVMRWAEVLG